MSRVILVSGMGVVMGCFHLLSDWRFTVVLLFFRSWIFVVPVF